MCTHAYTWDQAPVFQGHASWITCSSHVPTVAVQSATKFLFDAHADPRAGDELKGLHWLWAELLMSLLSSFARKGAAWLKQGLCSSASVPAVQFRTASQPNPALNSPQQCIWTNCRKYRRYVLPVFEVLSRGQSDDVSAVPPLLWHSMFRHSLIFGEEHRPNCLPLRLFSAWRRAVRHLHSAQQPESLWEAQRQLLASLLGGVLSTAGEAREPGWVGGKLGSLGWQGTPGRPGALCPCAAAAERRRSS